MIIKIDFANEEDTFSIPELKGTIIIEQKDKNNPTTFYINISGLTPNKLHGFHIHESPVIDKNDLYLTCNSCGGHFNPTKKNHGSIFNADPKDRHVGDLINNLMADENGNCQLIYEDDMACLIPNGEKNYTIQGRSIVIHQETDDLGREGLGRNLPYLYYDKKLDKNVIANVNNTKLPSQRKYKKKNLRDSSKVNGNAGKRIACANVIL